MKGNTPTLSGIIVSEYRKPNIFERILRKIRRIFERPRKLKNKWDAL